MQSITPLFVATYSNFFFRFSFGFHSRLFGGLLLKYTIQHGSLFITSLIISKGASCSSVTTIWSINDTISKAKYSQAFIQQLPCSNDDKEKVACTGNNANTPKASMESEKNEKHNGTKNGSRTGEYGKTRMLTTEKGPSFFFANRLICHPAHGLFPVHEVCPSSSSPWIHFYVDPPLLKFTSGEQLSATKRYDPKFKNVDKNNERFV